MASNTPVLRKSEEYRLFSLQRQRVPNRIFEIRDLASLELGMGDFVEIWKRDSGLHLWTGREISHYH